MFTGLIEAVCQVRSISRSAGSAQLSIDLGNLSQDCKIGDSIAINGVCLTIKSFQGNIAAFDVSPETLAKTTISLLKTSSPVNIERALSASGRFGGHFVLGHIDGTATITSIIKKSEFADIRFTVDTELLDFIIPKGSIAVDGISLTIADFDKNGFSVAIIPETLQKTTLQSVKIGDKVNIETDIIIKAVRKQLEKILPKNETITAERLKDLGF